MKRYKSESKADNVDVASQVSDDSVEKMLKDIESNSLQSGFGEVADDGYGFYDLGFDFQDDPIVSSDKSQNKDGNSSESIKVKEQDFSTITPMARVRSVTLNSEDLEKISENKNIAKSAKWDSYTEEFIQNSVEFIDKEFLPPKSHVEKYVEEKMGKTIER